MSSLQHLVAMSFGVSGIVRERGSYKTTDGTREIFKTKDVQGQILARHQIIEHCKKAGFPWMDHYYLTRQGYPCVFADGDNYVMTNRLQCRDTDFSDAAEFLQVIQTIAHWHRSARDVAFKDGAELSLSKNATPLTEIFRAKCEALDVIHKRIRRQSRWSDFDVLFLKNFSGYRERIRKALLMLEGTGYLKRWQNARQMGHICHGRPKEDCLRICEKSGEVYITKLDDAAVDYQLTDLWAIIRRKEKADGPTDRSLIARAYSEIIPLEPEEEIILEAMLTYPLAFVKIVTEYYRKKRTWTPVSLSNKISEILSSESPS